MKKEILIITIFIAICFQSIAQTTVNSNGDLIIADSKDLLFGENWGIEHWNNGLNIYKPWPSINNGNYKLYIKDVNGYIGIGTATPNAQLQITNNITDSWKPLFYGYSSTGRAFRCAISNSHTELTLYNHNNASQFITLRSDYWSELNDTKVTGQLLLNNLPVMVSDKRLKSNINEINIQTNKLNKIKSYSYVLKSDSIKIKKINGVDTLGKEKLDLQYGFIAQEVQDVYPELVYENDEGFLGIRYTAFIPLLLNAYKEEAIKITNLEDQIRELENTVKELENKTRACCYCSELKSHDEVETTLKEPVKNQIVLEQNTPNPFSETTDIVMFIPEEINIAKLYIYDINGTQQAIFNITERTSSNIAVAANTLKPGLYLYSLICDGELISTKQMVVTD